MSATRLGLIFCLSFVTLEAFGAVYLGSVFQGVDSSLIGMWVFAITVVGSVFVTAILRPAELIASYRSMKLVLALNLYAALTWSTYFIAVQLIEPAVVFTIFSGAVPLGTALASWIGIREAHAPKLQLVRVGNGLIAISILVLAGTTVAGLSGFVRGDALAAMAGVGLSALSGGFTAFVIVFSVRLNGRGVGPLAQFGLRFVLYTMLAFVAFLLGADDKGAAVPPSDLAEIVLIGLIVMALPLYLVQKAVPLIPAWMIAAMTALGPALVFAMQLFEGRVAYSTATLFGLTIYIAGALIAVLGATHPSREIQASSLP